MNLCIDIGNSRIKCGIFEGHKEVHFDVYESFDFKKFTALFDSFSITGCILSSTRNIDPEWLTFLNQFCFCNVLSENTAVPIVNLYQNPQTLGKDRLAAAVGANFLMPNENCIIINAGTCITSDFIDSKANFHGGSIAPGIIMRLKAMHHFTAKLPLVEIAWHDQLFANNTIQALQNGGVKGAIYEVSSFIREVEEKYGKSKVILTGGDSHIFVKHLNFAIFAFPNLVLLGLNEILRFNAGKFTT